MLTNNNTSVIHLDCLGNLCPSLQLCRIAPKVQQLIGKKNSGLDLKSIFASFLSIFGGYFRYIFTIALFSVISYTLTDMLVNFSRIQSTPAPTHFVCKTCDPSLKYGHPILNFHLAVQPYWLCIFANLVSFHALRPPPPPPPNSRCGKF